LLLLIRVSYINSIDEDTIKAWADVEAAQPGAKMIFMQDLEDEAAKKAANQNGSLPVLCEVRIFRF